MKKLLILVMLMAAGFNAQADQSTENKERAQNHVLVGSPTYEGLHFLALTGAEKFHEQDYKVSARADEVCKFLGYESAETLTIEDIQYSSEILNTVIKQKVYQVSVTTIETRESYWDPSIITNLICKTK